jgi:spermidine synthase
MIILRQRDAAGAEGPITEITLDHRFLMSSLNTVSERALSSFAIKWHGGENLRVLVGGLGLGYTAHEALASDRVGHVEVVELLEPVIGWTRDGLVPLSQELISELAAGGRLEIRQGDVYLELHEPPRKKYDLILIDVDNSPEEALGAPNDAFHSAQGAALAREHLAAGGVLGVWSTESSEAFVEALRSVFAEVEARALDFFNPVTNEPETNWVFLARG